MKIANIFKKKEKSEAKLIAINKLNSSQLEKIVGGGDKIWTDYNVHDPGIKK